MDTINKKILAALQENARVPNTEIGRRVGISSPAVAERIKKLEDQGVIEGYSARISPYAVGYQLEAIITLRAFMGKLKPFLSFIKTREEVMNCYRITGDENMVMQVVLENQQHLERFIDILIQYGECKTQIVLSQVVKDRAILP